MPQYHVWLDGTSYDESAIIDAIGYKDAIRRVFREYLTPPTNTVMRVIVQRGGSGNQARIFLVRFGQRGGIKFLD